MTKRVIVLLLLLAVTFALVACGGSGDGTTNGSNTNGGAVEPSGSGDGGSSVADGAALVQDRCTVCHSTSRIFGASKDLAGWQSTIDRMVGRGAKLTEEEQAVLAEYLAGL